MLRNGNVLRAFLLRVFVVIALAMALGACSTGGASGTGNGTASESAGSTAATLPPAPCESAVPPAVLAVEGTGLAVGSATEDACENGYALIRVEPDLAACAEIGVACERTWVFAQDSGEYDWFSIGYQSGARDCDESEAIRAACDALGIESE